MHHHDAWHQHEQVKPQTHVSTLRMMLCNVPFSQVSVLDMAACSLGVLATSSEALENPQNMNVEM
jgi:hypothetical protein